MIEMERKQLLRDFDRFAGGRSLTAIYESDDMDVYEHSIMLYFGHTAEFQKNGFVKLKPHRLETIAKKSRMSEDKARRTMKKLSDRGYLARVRRFAASGLELTPEYSLTWKIFDEYEEKWLDKRVEEKKANDLWGGQQPPPPGQQPPPPGQQPPPFCPSSVFDPSLVFDPSSDSITSSFKMVGCSRDPANEACKSDLPAVEQEVPAPLASPPRMPKIPAAQKPKPPTQKPSPVGPDNIPGFVELCKEVDWSLSENGKAYAHWETTQEFLAGIVEDHGDAAARLFGKWLEKHMIHRFQNGKIYKKSVPWSKKLQFSWDYFLEEIRRDGSNKSMTTH